MDAEHIVTTVNGPVRGTPSSRSGKVTVYRGIPYAAAPFGEHRFAAPRPASSWKEVRDCFEFGAPPPQGTQLIGAAPWSPDTSLDCLALNVWSAVEPDAKAPVLVWIHGGAYIVGSGSEATYEGSHLAAAGTVVVSLNYRLGFEGFGHVPGRPDNRGLLDQMAALRWVRDNITAFGGDPDNVTIAGESAGAGSVVCLMASPDARGLFHRAIAHSVPGDMITTDTARSVSEAVAEAAGVPLEAEALAALAPEKILEATDVVLSGRGRSEEGVRTKAFTCYAPVVGGPELPEAPLVAIGRGQAREVDLLVGHNTEEYRLFTELGQQVEIDGEEALAITAGRLGLKEGAVRAYRAVYPDASLQELFNQIQGDALFCEYSVRFAETHAAAGGRAFFFRFAAQSLTMEGRLGACHAFDLPFAFGNLDSDLAVFLCDGEPDAGMHALSERMVQAWRDFAATGDPGWPAVRPEGTVVRVWDVEDTVREKDTSPLRALWADVDFAPR